MSNLCLFCNKPIQPNDQASFDGVTCAKGDHLHTWCAPQLDAWAEDTEIDCQWSLEQRADGFYLSIKPDYVMKMFQSGNPAVLGPYPTAACAWAYVEHVDAEDHALRCTGKFNEVVN